MSAIWIAGVDEAGRGPLAGPVTAAAVILHPDRPIEGLDDSKRLSAKRREALAPKIRDLAHAWAVVHVHAPEIDAQNILQATLSAMRHAVCQLSCQPEKILIDGNRMPPGLPATAETIVGGDALHACISAASILAKTTRDALMLAAEQDYPGYGFAQHKGYGTAAHLAALRRLGPSALHRRSFAPVLAAAEVCKQQAMF